MKNTVYAVIIVVCLIVTGVIVFVTHWSNRNLGVPNSLQTWVLCTSCGDSHQMSLKNFWKQQKARMSAATSGPPPAVLTCVKCGKNAVVEAFKCPKCGVVSRKGNPLSGEFDDRCPKCGFSQLEADVEAKAEKNP
jgi:predicted RNA-binding Zn-ribbon protein involved in translation (DUF1610 family)